jgi:hypothetical protein
MSLMSETSETPTVRTGTATLPPPPPAAEVVHRTPRVFQFAAWVAIVAGIVFIVSVIFFSGYTLGKHSGHGHHGHKHHAMMGHPHRFGGPGGPGGGPWGAPGAIPPGAPAPATPGAPGPGQIPSSVLPSHTATP